MREILLEDISNFDSLVAEIVEVMQKGGVVLMPSDTCYGFSGDAFNPAVRQKIHQLKEMPEDKPISVSCSDMDMVLRTGDFDDFGRELAVQYLPDKLTLVVDSKDERLGESIGIRLPKHELMRQVAERLGHPIFTTSANIHGKPSPYALEQCAEGADLIIDAGVLDEVLPSTVVQILDHKIEILREGELSLNMAIQYGAKTDFEK